MKPLKRAWLKQGTKPIPRVNVERMARRKREYAKALRSARWKALRYKVWERDTGLCQCPDCIDGRKNDELEAFERVAIWFDTKGGVHGFDVHHTTYARFGNELLSDLLLMIPAHHRRLEALTGKRKRFLSRR